MADYGFEIFSSSGQLLHSSDDYGWVVLDSWWQQPVQHHAPFSRTWTIPTEFTDFKLFTGGLQNGNTSGEHNLSSLARHVMSDCVTYELLDSSVDRLPTSTVISVNLRVIRLDFFLLDGRLPNSAHGVLVGR